MKPLVTLSPASLWTTVIEGSEAKKGGGYPQEVFHMNIRVWISSSRFLTRLRGVTDPERKERS